MPVLRLSSPPLSLSIAFDKGMLGGEGRGQWKQKWLFLLYGNEGIGLWNHIWNEHQGCTVFVSFYRAGSWGWVIRCSTFLRSHTYEVCSFLMTLKRFSSMSKQKFANDVLYKVFKDCDVMCACAHELHGVRGQPWILVFRSLPLFVWGISLIGLGPHHMGQAPGLWASHVWSPVTCSFSILGIGSMCIHGFTWAQGNLNKDLRHVANDSLPSPTKGIPRGG